MVYPSEFTNLFIQPLSDAAEGAWNGMMHADPILLFHKLIIDVPEFSVKRQVQTKKIRYCNIFIFCKKNTNSP
jgi:hypothetical protein